MLLRQVSRRGFSSAVRFHAQGSPAQVLKLESVKEDNKTSLKTNEVALKFLAAPINPADLNMIQGGYGITPTLPAVGGNEGVAQVEAVGSGVTSLKVGDRVIPAVAGFGTWRNTATASESDVLKVAKDIPVEYAATIAVNPSTAYRLLADFVELKKGDVVIQNGANSAVGQFIIQLAKLKGIKTINVVREDDQYGETVNHLKGLGADIVCTDAYLGSADFKRLIADLPAPKLALNCVGGANGLNVAKSLGKKGVFVTYGGMSREPVMTSATSLIFNDISMCGFWMTEWSKNASIEERKTMLTELANLMKDGKIRSWVETYKLNDFEDALSAVLNRTTKRKIVLLME